MTLPKHIPGALINVPILQYFEYLERNHLAETGKADKRVFDPTIGKHGAYVRPIVYIGPSVPAGQTDEILDNDIDNSPAGIFIESEQP